MHADGHSVILLTQETTADDIYGIDTDLGLLEWHNRLATGIKQPAKSTAACPGGMTSSLAPQKRLQALPQ